MSGSVDSLEAVVMRSDMWLFTLSLLKQHPGKMSRVMKRKSCGWNWKFLLQVLGIKGTWCALALGQQALHKNLAAEAYLKGTKELGEIRNTILHQLESKNLVNSGWSLPEFFKGVSVDDIRRFAE